MPDFLIEKLPLNVCQEDLIELFSNYGSCSAQIANHEAIVSFTTTDDAFDAHEGLKGEDLGYTLIPLFSMKRRQKRISKIGMYTMIN